MKNWLKTIFKGIPKKPSSIPTTLHVSPSAKKPPILVSQEDLKSKTAQIQVSGMNKLKAVPKKESPVANIFEEVFSKIKTIVKNIYADEQKVGAVLATVKADVPATVKAFQPFWAASLQLYSALITAVDDKGLNIPVDSAAFTAAKAWFASFHSVSTVIETDYKSIAADFAAVPATPEPVIAPAAPPVIPA